jgi:hypothetical protein
MSKAPETSLLPTLPRVLGHVGLWASVAGVVACVLLMAMPGNAVAGALFLPVAALAVWLSLDFLRLEDWRVAPDLPLGVKVIGHSWRVIGSVAAAACASLVVLTILFPGSVPPAPVRWVDGAWQAISADAAAYRVARPALVVTYLLVFLACLGVRVLGSAMAEFRRGARGAALVVLGAAGACLTAALVLNATQWRVPFVTGMLLTADVLVLGWFVFLLSYLVRPHVAAAFEARGL